jgi:uncharacterized membrane protein
MPKFIREGRFGPPKTWKTGAVCDTYPKPMLVFEYEAGGLEIVKGYPDCVRYIQANEVDKLLKGTLADYSLSALKPITAIDLSFVPNGVMLTGNAPAASAEGFDNTAAAINALIYAKAFPFKTVVLDTVTGLSEAILRHISKNNSAMLADARKWAGLAGSQVSKTISYINYLPCNTVFIFHTETNKDEDTKVLSEQPMMYSKLRECIGKDFSQFFYQTMMGGKPQIRVKSFDLVRGIGVRWPQFTTELVDPTFDAIYGKEKDVWK